MISALKQAIYGSDMPPRTLIDRMMLPSKNRTPDGLDIIQKEQHRIFVPDLFKLDDETTIIREQGFDWCSGFTRRAYTMVKNRLGMKAYPIAIDKRYPSAASPDKDHFPFLPIRGKIISVPPETIFLLDNYRENGKIFIRKRVEIAIPRRDVLRRKESDPRGGLSKRGRPIVWTTGVIVEGIHCWMYVGVPGFWEPQLDAGYRFRAVKTFPYTESPNMKFKEFYWWQKQELYDK